MIRVMFVVPDLRIGGAERHVTTLTPSLDSDRFSPSVVCIGRPGELFGDLRAAGVPAEALNLGGKRNAWRALRALVARMRSDRPDVVIMRGYNAEILGRVAALLSGVRHRVVWVHGSDFGVENRTHDRILLERLFSHATSRYFGVAEAQRRYLVDSLHCPPERVRIIHNGVDTSFYDPRSDRAALDEFGIPLDAPVVGIVAALREEKDHRTLLRAAEIAVQEIPNLHILIVGQGAIRPELESFAAELGLSAQVHFAGARSDVQRILRAVDIFTLSSVKETFPISVLEAMACGRPVVCTNVGGVAEAVVMGETGYLVPPGDAQTLALRWTELARDPDLARRMGAAGRRRVEEEFTLKRSVEKSEEAIEEMVEIDRSAKWLARLRIGRDS